MFVVGLPPCAAVEACLVVEEVHQGEVVVLVAAVAVPFAAAESSLDVVSFAVVASSVVVGAQLVELPGPVHVTFLLDLGSALVVVQVEERLGVVFLDILADVLEEAFVVAQNEDPGAAFAASEVVPEGASVAFVAALVGAFVSPVAGLVEEVDS